MNIDNKNASFIRNLIIYFGGIFFNLISLFIFKGEYRSITYLLIIINVIPIYPLDGYMVLKTLISYIFPYKISLIMINIISIITLAIAFIVLIPNLDYLLLFNLLCLLIMSIKEIKNIKHTYQAFILGRYLNPPSYNLKKVKFRHNSYDYLYRYHKIYTNVGYKRIEENDILMIKYLK